MIIHVELGEQVAPLIWKIKSLGKKVGLAVNPPTAIAEVQPYLDQIDLLLVMTVNPGFGGQEFIHETLPKIQQAEAWRRERKLPYRISVDGGINFQTGRRMRARRRGHICQPARLCFARATCVPRSKKCVRSSMPTDPALADLKL